jgi:hypothetical protein
MVATAKPRRRRSATTSKYFSMNSPLPWNMHTVPRRGGRVASQRANRNRMPPGDLRTPAVAPLGTGFLASATRSIAEEVPYARATQGNLYQQGARIQTGVKSEGPGGVPEPPQLPIAPGLLRDFYQRRGSGP